MRKRLRALWQVILRRRWLALVLVLVLCSLVTGAGFHVWGRSHYQAALQAFQKEKYAEARDHLDLCLRIPSWRTATTHFLAARLHRMLGEFAKAEHYLQLCQEQQGGPSEQTKLEALLIRAESGFFDEAEPELLVLLAEQHPESASILRTMAKYYFNQSRFTAALISLNQWLKIKPDSAEAHDWRGMAFEKLDLSNDALLDFKTMVQLAPHRSPGRLRLVQLLLNQSNGPEALPHIKYLLQEEPNRPDYLVAMGRCKVLEGEMALAREYYDQALAGDPANYEILFYRAQLEYQDQQFAAAATWSRKTIKANPYFPHAYYLLHIVLLKDTDPARQAEAASALKKFQHLKAEGDRLLHLTLHELAQRPNSPEVLSEIGAICLRNGQEEVGLLWLERALSKDPRHQATHQLLADYFRTHNYPELASKHKHLATIGPK